MVSLIFYYEKAKPIELEWLPVSKITFFLGFVNTYSTVLNEVFFFFFNGYVFTVARLKNEKITAVGSYE